MPREHSRYPSGSRHCRGKKGDEGAGEIRVDYVGLLPCQDPGEFGHDWRSIYSSEYSQAFHRYSIRVMHARIQRRAGADHSHFMTPHLKMFR